jgi:SAM-dependent methyltransferase
VTDLYTSDWYAAHLPYRAEYHAVADVIRDVLALDGESVIDVGCGCGYLLERLYEKGCDVLGIEASETAIAHIPSTIRDVVAITDATRTSIPFGMFNVAICTEVAEHVPESDADALVAFVSSRALHRVVFTAATPGQGGTGHVNEQPHGYWIEKFRKRGFVILTDETTAMRAKMAVAAPNMPWFGRNVMCLGWVR